MHKLYYDYDQLRFKIFNDAFNIQDKLLFACIFIRKGLLYFQQ